MVSLNENKHQLNYDTALTCVNLLYIKLGRKQTVFFLKYLHGLMDYSCLFSEVCIRVPQQKPKYYAAINLSKVRPIFRILERYTRPSKELDILITVVRSLIKRLNSPSSLFGAK